MIMKFFITSIFFYFALSSSSFAINLNPISVGYTRQILGRLGLLGQEEWLIDRRKAIETLQEISMVIEKDKNATYEQVITKINNNRAVDQPPVDEGLVYRLMDEAGLLKQDDQSFFNKEKELREEIREIWSWYPGASYLRVAAELNNNRLAKGNTDIIFWPQVYMIMERVGWLVNNDSSVSRELEQLRTHKVHREPMQSSAPTAFINGQRDVAHHEDVIHHLDKGRVYINESQVYRLMSQEEYWIIDRRKIIETLHEILEVLERYPNADPKQVIAEINSLRPVNYQPLVDEELVERLMVEIGILEQDKRSLVDKESFDNKNKEWLKEIREVLSWYPGANYLRVTAELNSIRFTEGNTDIIFWPRVYMIMERNDLLINNEASIDEEIRQMREQEFYGEPLFDYKFHQGQPINMKLVIYLVTKEVFRKSYVFNGDKVYRLIILEEGWLWLKPMRKYMEELRKLAQSHKKNFKTITDNTQSASKINDIKILAEIKEVLADFQEAGFKEVTFLMVTAEINYRRLQGKSIKSVSKDTVRIMHQTDLLQELQFIVSEEKQQLLDETIDFLEQNPDADYEMLFAHISKILSDEAQSKVHFHEFMTMVTSEINYRRSQEILQLGESIEAVSKDTVYRIMHQAGLLKEKRQAIMDEEDRLLDQAIVFLEQNPGADYEMLLAHTNNQVSEEHFHEFITKTGLLVQEIQPTGNIQHTRIYQEIIERLAYDQEASYIRLTAEYNMALSTRDKSRESSNNEHETHTTEEKPKEKSKRPKERRVWLFGEVMRVLNIEEYSKYGYVNVTQVINSKLSRDKEVNKDIVRNLMARYNLVGRKQRPRNQTEFEKIWEEAGITEEEREAITRGEEFEDIDLTTTLALEKEKRFLPIIKGLNEKYGHGPQPITEIINSDGTLPKKEQIKLGWVSDIMRKHGIKGRQGKVIDHEADALILEAAKSLIYANINNPSYGVVKLRTELNQNRLAQISDSRLHRILNIENLLPLLNKKEKRKRIASGATGVGLIAAAGAEQSHTQDHFTSEYIEAATPITETNPLLEINEFTSGITPHTEGITFEMVDMLSTIIETGSYLLEGGGEATPFGVGAAISVSAILTGIHPMTRRPLTREERTKIAKWMPLNFIGWKFLQHPIKNLAKQVNFSKLMSLFNKDQLKRAKQFLDSFFRPTGNGNPKVRKKPKSKPPKRNTLGGGRPSENVTVTRVIRVDERFNRITPDEFIEAVDPDTLFRPNTHTIITQTLHRKEIPLDFNDPEALKWLQYRSTTQGQTLRTLINTGKKETADFSDLVLN